LLKINSIFTSFFMLNTWYIIANPTSGNGIVQKKWSEIITTLKQYKIQYEFSFSAYKNHEKELVFKALEKGYKKFISIGGDGTLHQIVNAAIIQKIIDPQQLKIGIIPMGTGNDWVKTYKIPKNIKQAIGIIRNQKTYFQDIGKLELLNTNTTTYFNNLAGIGFDGFVVKNVMKYKKYGAFSYLIATIVSFLKYKQQDVTIEFNDIKIKANVLLTLVGICKYSGGGMQLTEIVDTNDGLFDISIAKNFSFMAVLFNILKFYNGTITHHKKVEVYKTDTIKIYANEKTFIQADGELIGSGAFKATIIPRALGFIIL